MWCKSKPGNHCQLTFVLEAFAKQFILTGALGLSHEQLAIKVLAIAAEGQHQATQILHGEELGNDNTGRKAKAHDVTANMLNLTRYIAHIQVHRSIHGQSKGAWYVQDN